MLGAGDVIREQEKTKSLHYEAYILVRETGEKSCDGNPTGKFITDCDKALAKRN